MTAIEGIPVTQRPEVPYPRFSMGQLAPYRRRYDEARALASIRCLHFLNDDVCVDLREREMYPRIADMVMFVSQRIKTAMDDRRRAGEETPANANILLPNGKWDIKPLGADDDHRIDGALAPYELSSPVRPKGRPDYSKTAMVIEVKRHRREHISAYAQAIAYTRQLYAMQINRHHTWALTMCGTE
ncbi:hypothetical protein EV175_006882, partial [Coemansia sp. RSA 1933]